MNKVYNSVDLHILEAALERIKISSSIIKTISQCFQNRNNTVITHLGLTDPYEVNNGIDQGDTISPILWRIYYDPLISKISKKAGYKCLNNSYDFHQLNTTRYHTNISVAAYMDDTAWISDSKENMEETLQTATSFFCMSHIQANLHKSFIFTLGER
jgi:hypothetical protein